MRQDHDPKDVKRWRKREAYLHNLGSRKLIIEDEFRPMDSEGKDHALVFYKLHGPFALLLRQAEKLRLRLPLKDADLKGQRRTLLQVLAVLPALPSLPPSPSALLARPPCPTTHMHTCTHI